MNSTIPSSIHLLQRSPAGGACLAALALAGLLPAESSAQAQLRAPAGAPRELRAVLAQSSGLYEQDGQLLALGADYKASFSTAGLVFTPALGQRSARNLPIELRLESVRRGATPVDGLSASGAPVARGSCAVFERGQGIEERYEVRHDGLEQSFVFEHALPGAGDLVLRARLGGELAQSARSQDGGLCFERAGVGGVRIGALTGIDASGARCAGTLRSETDAQGTWLELALPAAFVDSASYPLVLDPWVGAIFPLEGESTLDDSAPDLAYDATTGNYLVVWERAFSQTDHDIRAQRVSAAGALVGGMLAVESGTSTLAVAPAVANVNQSDRFLVVWEQRVFGQADPDVECRSVRAQDGASSNIVALASGPVWQYAPDVGGDATSADDDALVVFANGIANTQIEGRQVNVPSVGDPSTQTIFFPPQGATNVRPAISKSGGASGRFLIAWQAVYAIGDQDIYGYVCDRNAAPLSGFQPITTTTLDETHVDVDGDGTRFAIAWQTERAAAPGKFDIFASFAKFDAQSGALTADPAAKLSVAVSNSDRDPAVAWLGKKVLVAFANLRNGPDNWDTHCMDIEVKTHKLGVYFELDDDGLGAEQTPALATQRSGDPAAADGALAVWSHDPLSGTGQGDLRAQLLEEFGTPEPIVDLGGNCGGGGSTQLVGPALLGNDEFAVELNGADPSASLAILNISPPYALLGCGNCLWEPFFVTHARSLLAGHASVALWIPDDVQLVGPYLYFQWTVLPTASSPCSLFANVSVSNVLQTSLAW